MAGRPPGAATAMPAPLATRLLLAAALVGSGTFIALLHFGVVPWRTHGRCRAVFCDPYHWQVLCFAVAFVLAGLAFVVPRRAAGLGRACALGFVAALASALVGTFGAR